MAHELAIHRWDAQGAIGPGACEPIARERAVDGIDEMLDLMPHRFTPVTVTGNGETLHLHCTDGDGEWLIRLVPDGFGITREHAKGDVAARGSASDLLLFLYGRVDAGALEVFGDGALLARWQREVAW
jgi:hypothetical protein